MSTGPKSKKVKSPSAHKTTLFQHQQDIQHYNRLMYLLDESLNNNENFKEIDLFIIKEISEYATGNYIKCIEDKCDGDIHYLYGDNFGDNSTVYGYTDRQEHHNIKLTYSYCLFKYQCDDINCMKISHLLKCNDKQCGLIMQFDREEAITSRTSIFLCASGYPCRKKCYCKDHWSKNGVQCQSCNSFFCDSCKQAHPNYCNQCKKYICKEHDDSSICINCLDKNCKKYWCEHHQLNIILT